MSKNTVNVTIDVFLLSLEEQEKLLTIFSDITNKLEFSNISKNDDDIDEVKLLPYYGKYEYEIDDINYKINYYTEGEYMELGQTIDKKRILEIECDHYVEKDKNLEAIKNLLIRMNTKDNKKLKIFLEYLQVVKDFGVKIIIRGRGY